MVEKLQGETESLKNRIVESSTCSSVRGASVSDCQEQREAEEAQKRLLLLEKDLIARHASQQKCTSRDCFILGIASCIKALAAT